MPALHTPGSAPPVNYPQQVQEVCLVPDSDHLWALTPPALKAGAYTRSHFRST